MIEIKGIDPNMIANNIEPFAPTHPGELLKDEIECRGISQKQLAADMGVSYTVLNDIVNGKVRKGDKRSEQTQRDKYHYHRVDKFGSSWPRRLL